MTKKVYYLNMGLMRDRELYEKILNEMETGKLSAEIQSSNWASNGQYYIFLVVACSSASAAPSQN